MYKSKRPWVLPLTLFIVSTALNYIITFRECGTTILKEHSAWEWKVCGEKTWMKAY